jgi:hypothetical protein
MGYKCNQSSSTLNNEVTNNRAVLNSLNASTTKLSSCDGSEKYDSGNILWYIYKWYTKTASTDDATSNSTPTDYEISKISTSDSRHVKCNEDESSSLAYREYHNHKRTHNIRTTTTTRAQCTHNTATTSSNISHSHYLVRQSICLYAASSVILALCYLTTTVSASPDAASHPA